MVPARAEGGRPAALGQVVDGRGCALLVRPDHACRAALDPAGAVEPGDRRAVCVENAPVDVRHGSVTLVERHPGEADAPVADAAKNDSARKDLALLGRDCAHAPVLVRLEPVVHDLDRLDAALHHEWRRARRGSEGARNAACRWARGSRSRGGSRRCAARCSSLPRAPPRSPGRARARPGQRRTSAPARSPSSPEFGRRPRCLNRPPTPEHDDLADPRGDDRLDRSVRRVGRRELLAL